jgi:hypothetical protein
MTGDKHENGKRKNGYVYGFSKTDLFESLEEANGHCRKEHRSPLLGCWEHHNSRANKDLELPTDSALRWQPRIR